MEVQRPDDASLVLCTFQLRSEHEVQAGTGVVPGHPSSQPVPPPRSPSLPQAKDAPCAASRGPQHGGGLPPCFFPTWMTGGGEVTVPLGLGHHGAGRALRPVLSVLKTPATYSKQVHQGGLSPLENQTFKKLALTSVITNKQSIICTITDIYCKKDSLGYLSSTWQGFKTGSRKESYFIIHLYGLQEKV